MLEQPPLTWRNSAALSVWLVNAWAMTLYVPIRRNLGREHLGLVAVIGLIWLATWGAMAESRVLAWLLFIDIYAMICHRLKDMVRTRRGQFVHTFYNGEPWLIMTVFRVKDEMKAKWLEPFLAAGLGIYLLQFNPIAGWYFIGGAVAMLHAHRMVAQCEQQRIDDMRNGMLENAELMRNFQKHGRRRV